MTHGTGRVGHKKEPEMARRHTATTACRRAVLSRLGILDRLRKLGIDSLGRQLLQLFFGSRMENCLLSARHRALGTGRVCRPHILCLIPLDEDIPFLSHATARRLCRRSNIEIGVASSDITLALLQQHRVLGDPATVCSYPCHFGSPRRCYTAQQEARHSHKARHTCPSTRSRKQSTNKRHRSLSDVEGFMAYYV
jgi:hypothetical protein